MTKEYFEADKTLQELNKVLIETNPIMISYKNIQGKPIVPLSYINVFKFLEEMMDKKYESDKKDIHDMRQMKSMTEFMMEHISRNFGVQTLALKFVAQFIPGLYQVYSQGHIYAIFFARILQLFHSDPVPYSLSLYLVRIRMEFSPLIEKYERFLGLNKKNNSQTEKNHGRSGYEDAGTGGLALLGDVIELVYNIFSSDKESGTKALDLLKPALVSVEDYVAFKICHKMAKLGKTPEMIFNILDKDKGGTIDPNEFLTGTKEDLDLWIPDSMLEKLLKSLTNTENNEITKEAFMSRINLKALIE